MLACINKFFCGVFQQPAQPSSERLHHAMSPRTYARASIDFPVILYRATAPAARSSSTASLYSELAEMRVVLDRPQADRRRVQPNSPQSAPRCWTTVPAAQPQIQFRTTPSGGHYSIQPAVNPGLGHFYQTHYTPQLIHRDYRGGAKRTAQTSFPTMMNPTLSSQTYARATRPPDFLATPYRDTAQAAQSRSTAHVTVRPYERLQAARTRIQPIHNNQRVPHRTIAQVAQHQIQFRTTSSGITYSTQPAVDPGLGNFYQINCTPQIIRRDYRGEPQRTAQTSLSTRPQLTHNQNGLSLNQLEIHKAIKKIIESDEKNEPEMLTIMFGLFRQEALNQIADRKAAQLEAQQQSLPVNHRQTVDRMETRLFYHSALKKRLQLPGETIFMSCGERISVSEQEVQQAGDKVLRIEKLDSNSLIDFISKNEHWQNYLQKHYQSLHDQDSSITLHESRLEQLEEDLEQQKINDNEYLQHCNQLMRERETASKAWFHAKNHELIHKHLVPQGYPTSFNG